MAKLQMKINGEWLTLPMDFTTGMEQTSPVFNEQGTFSFPFEVPLEPNRHVFKNLADPHGHLNLKHVNGLDAELWFNGILLYKGKTETEGEVELTESVPMTFISGNSDFMSRIDGMNARDVPLDREIEIGKIYTEVGIEQLNNFHSEFRAMPKLLMGEQNTNISQPYPFPYCNARVCATQMKNVTDEKGNPTDEWKANGYKVMEYNRPYSGVCFYVMYFLEVLMQHLGMYYDKMSLATMEDMARLAFWNTRCEYDLGEEENLTIYAAVKEIVPSLTVVWKTGRFNTTDGPSFVVTDKSDQVQFRSKKAYANSKNFPDVQVKDIIDALTNGFGVRFVYDDQTNRMKAVYLKDLFRSQETVNIHAQVLAKSVTKYKHNGYKVTYGNDDDTNFNYSDYTNVYQESNYLNIIKTDFTRYDTKCYYDSTTGNAYRVKVDKENGENPVLFEVGGFNPYVSADATENVETLELPFTPVVLNDTNFQKEKESSDNNQITTQTLAPFADVEIRETALYRYNYRSEWLRETTGEEESISFQLEENYDIENEDLPPLRTYDTGFTLGIMRGPGSDANLDIIQDNYDGEGNDWYTYTVGNYAFTADSIDNYGRTFDYNGTEEGGVDQSGRFSLKLVAEKPGLPIDSQHANRGLVAKFLSEYLYFMERRKLITFDVKMSISDIIHVDFLKRARIGEHVGWINKITYTLGMEDITDVKIEMYTL